MTCLFIAVKAPNSTLVVTVVVLVIVLVIVLVVVVLLVHVSQNSGKLGHAA